MSGDPFANWRHPTGRTGERGDYTDGAPQGHKKLAAHYAKHHRPQSHAAKQAVQHPGADPSHYANAMNAADDMTFNKDPMAVSWSGNKDPFAVIPYEGEKIPHPIRVQTGTWDRREIHPVRTNKAAIMRQMLNTDAVVLERQPIGRKISLKTLKTSPGLPFYTPQDPIRVENTNNSAQLRAQHGRRSRRLHNVHTGKKVRVAKHGVRNLDVRQWVDNLDTLTSPRAYWNYSMQTQNRQRWVNT